jgi:hypothetical protein
VQFDAHARVAVDVDAVHWSVCVASSATNLHQLHDVLFSLLGDKIVVARGAVDRVGVQEHGQFLRSIRDTDRTVAMAESTGSKRDSLVTAATPNSANGALDRGHTHRRRIDREHSTPMMHLRRWRCRPRFTTENFQRDGLLVVA